MVLKGNVIEIRYAVTFTIGQFKNELQLLKHLSGNFGTLIIQWVCFKYLHTDIMDIPCYFVMKTNFLYDIKQNSSISNNPLITSPFKSVFD